MMTRLLEWALLCVGINSLVLAVIAMRSAYSEILSVKAAGLNGRLAAVASFHRVTAGTRVISSVFAISAAFCMLFMLADDAEAKLRTALFVCMVYALMAVVHLAYDYRVRTELHRDAAPGQQRRSTDVKPS